MKFCGRLALLNCLLAFVVVAPVAAGVSPYVRLDYGSNQLRMTDGNNLIHENEASLKAAGYPADFQDVAEGYGPSASIGLWILPGLRIGGTYSSLHSVRRNRYHEPGQLFFADDLDFRLTEWGGEAAVRINRLRGLTLGANVAQGRSEMTEGFSVEDSFGQFYQDAKATRTRPTYGAYLGLDQTNPSGVAGFFRFGFQYREVGRVPSQLTISDGYSSSQATGETIWLDYSGFYFRLGVGYDLKR